MPLVLKWSLVEWVEWVSSWMTQAWSASSFDQNRPGQKIWKRLDHNSPRLCMWQLTLQSRTEHSLLTIAKFSWTKKRTAHTHNLERSPRYDEELARDLLYQFRLSKNYGYCQRIKWQGNSHTQGRAGKGLRFFKSPETPVEIIMYARKKQFGSLKQANGSMLRINVQTQMLKISKLLNLVAALGF